MREFRKATAIRHGVLLFCCLVFTPIVAHSDEEPTGEIGITLEWDPNPEPEVVGYYVYVGTQSSTYTRVINTGPQVFARVSPLDPGVTYYFAVTARSSDGLESPFSDEISYTAPIDGIRATLTPLRMSLANAADPAMLEFGTQAGFHYLVQASVDLRTWQTLESFTPDTDGSIAWDDPEAFLYELRFYRVIALSP
jgi:hypothetical protein